MKLYIAKVGAMCGSRVSFSRECVSFSGKGLFYSIIPLFWLLVELLSSSVKRSFRIKASCVGYTQDGEVV